MAARAESNQQLISGNSLIAGIPIDPVIPLLSKRTAHPERAFGALINLCKFL